MIAIAVKPKTKVVSRVAVFQDRGAFITFCEENDLDVDSFDWEPLHINDRKFSRLSRFEGEVSPKGWI